MNKYLKLFISIAIPLLIGFIGSYATGESLSTWYVNLKKPFFNPPNWIFGPVWTTLYILMGISLYIFWQSDSKYKKPAIEFFSIQLILNLLWSFLFFYFESPFYAFLEIVILWIFIILTIFYAFKISKLAGFLLIPYILWVSFAAILNFYIYLLN